MTTREDQLRMKQKKQDQEDEDGEKPSSTRGRARGRGPGGRGGKGRGRGRGKKNEETDASKDETARASSSKTDTHLDEANETAQKKPKTRTRNGKAKQDDGWAAWGTNDAWSQGWADDDWDYSAWAWDSTAYWDAQASMHELEEQHAPQQTNSSKASKSPKPLPVTNEEKVADKELNGQEKNRSKKRATKEVEGEKEPKSHSGRKQKRTGKSKGDDAADDNKHSKKRARAATPGEEGSASTAHDTRKKKAAAAPAEPTGASSTKAVSSDVLPSSKKGRLDEIISFMNGFKNMKEQDAYVLMRGRLQGTTACRLNVYGKRATAAVGIHVRKEKRDFGYISLSHPECPKHIQLAAASKAAEMLVTCI